MVNAKIDPSHIVKGPYEDVLNIPDTDIYSFIFERERIGNFPPQLNFDRVAFIDGPSGRKITFRELKERVILLSRGLAKGMGIKRDEAVCFFMPNHVYRECFSVDSLVGLSYRVMGMSPTWRLTILCQSNLYSSRTCPSTKAF